MRNFSERSLIAIAALAFLIVAVEKAKPQGQADLKTWFNQLKSPAGGVCCHNFDGISLEEDTWRVIGDRYQVQIKDKWVDVPELNVVNEPNRLGRAHLWLREDGSVRCFMPGVMG